VKDETLAQWLRRTDMEFIAGATLPPKLLHPTVADYNDLRQQLRKANLGLATTREMLEELKTRGQVGMITEESSTDHNHLEADASHLLTCLPREVLDYRTADHV
jgi:hypothetical protein